MLLGLVCSHDEGGILDFNIVGGEEVAVPLQLEEGEVAVERRYVVRQRSADWDGMNQRGK